MIHQVTPDQDDENISLGRYFDQESYQREKKALEVENNRIDVFYEENGELMVGEVKKSSKYRNSARMQLAYYLKKLKENGVRAKGELRFPKEKTREEVKLDEKLEEELEKMELEIKKLLLLSVPPPPQQIVFCKNCGYSEFCWS